MTKNLFTFARFWWVSAIGTRIFLGLIFLGGGMSKLMPFPGVMGPVWLEEQLEPYGLGLFARFIAWSEAIIGLLLLSGRFATLGAIMLLPLLLNIFFAVVSMHWRGTPYVIAGFIFMNLYLLVYDYPRIRLLFFDDPLGVRAVPVRRIDPKADVISLLGMGFVLSGPYVFTVQMHTSVAMIILGLGAMLYGAIRKSKAAPIRARV